METTTTSEDDLGIFVYIYTYLRPYPRRPATKRTRSMNLFLTVYLLLTMILLPRPGDETNEVDESVF